MLEIVDVVRPESIEEAIKFNKDIKSRFVGGGAFLRLSNLKITRAIDLSQLRLDEILIEDKICMGSMVTLRALETHKALQKYFGDVIGSSVKDIVGVQLRNIATIGGTVVSQYGFSDLITALLVLETDLVFSNHTIPLEDSLKKSPSKTLLKAVHIKKDERQAVFKSLRNSKSDFAMLNVAVSLLEGKFIIAVGARPRVASLAYKAMTYLNSCHTVEVKDLEKAAKIAMEELSFGSNRFASEFYRKMVCQTLVKNALVEVMNVN